jgi:hypothetical protein
MQPQNAESRSDSTILLAEWRKFLTTIITISTQLKNADWSATSLAVPVPEFRTQEFK